MQMSNEYNWSERSISYAARSFDQLNSGEEYKEVLPVHSIGFLNFTLFEDQPEFFATYELRNKKTGHLYSSKFSIHVLDLTRIDLATAEDQNYEIDRWAKLFKAKTWEELRMIAKNNPDLLQASNDLYTVNADEIIRQQARARADAEFWERNKNAKINGIFMRQYYHDFAQNKAVSIAFFQPLIFVSLTSLVIVLEKLLSIDQLYLISSSSL